MEIANRESIYNVTCSTDDNYVQHCLAMLCSLFENNKNRHFAVHLIYGSLSDTSKHYLSLLCRRYENEIKFYEIDNATLSNVKVKHKALSVATYYRLLLPNLLDANIDRVLYLDCDVIVLRDIIELYALNLEGYGVAAVKDQLPCDNCHRNIIGMTLNQIYFCAGVMMINLNFWRNHNCCDNMVKFAEEFANQLLMEDQDVLNHEFCGKWFQLPYKYGKSPYAIASLDSSNKWVDQLEFAFTPSIIHFAADIKPWLNIRVQYDEYYWHYANLSGFPNVKKTIASIETCKKARRLKTRYYLNAYLRPLIPNILEMLVMDIFYLLLFIFTCIFRPKQIKPLLLKLWLRKYL